MSCNKRLVLLLNSLRYAALSSINYTCYYTDFHAMTDADRGAQRFAVDNPWGGGDTVYNYRSSHDWIDVPGISDVQRSSPQEQLLYHCHAMGVSCKASPSPAPPTPSKLSAACKAGIEKLCAGMSTQQTCVPCIRGNAKQLINQDQCPTPAQGGYATCLAYCASRK